MLPGLKPFEICIIYPESFKIWRSRAMLSDRTFCDDGNVLYAVQYRSH